MTQTQTPLLPRDQTEQLTGRWEEIQASFVDRPQRERLEKQWSVGDDVSTEDLRVALTRYRSFFDRLLAT
jgi:hypothetical protein